MALKIGYPYDPVVRAKQKHVELVQLLLTRATAWHGYFKNISQAYKDAHDAHTTALKGIKDSIMKEDAFVREVLFGSVIPAMVGAGMASLVADAGEKIFGKLLSVAEKEKSSLAESGAAAIASGLTKDTVKFELKKSLNGLVAEPGSAWDAVGPDPLKFFLQVDGMIDTYVTDATDDIETKRNATTSMDGLDDYVNTLNAHLLSPFIQKAPMKTARYYSDDDLSPIYEVFLYVLWARQRNVKYWSRRIYDVTAGDSDVNVFESVGAAAEMAKLNPIVDRLVAAGIQESEYTQVPSSGGGKRLLNVLWLRFLGDKHRGSLLSDLTNNLDAKAPTSAFEDGPFNKNRRLK